MSKKKPELKTTLLDLENGIWTIDQEMVRSFVIVGTKFALVIDTGASKTDYPALVRGITALPCGVALTHTDGDHTANLKDFSVCWVHESEQEKIAEQGIKIKCVSLRDGDVIDLGGRRIEVLHLPGHTPGSLAYLDIENRILFSGDSVSYESVFMFGDGRDPEVYIESLERLNGMTDYFDAIYPCHGLLPVEKDAIGELIECTKGAMAGTIEPEEPDKTAPEGITAKKYSYGKCSILY